MDALEAIAARRSIGRLVSPAPQGDDLRRILEAALVAPDHGELEPWKLIVLEGRAKEEFGTVLADSYLARCSDMGAEPSEAKLTKERTKLGRAPLVLVVAAVHRHSDKVPWEEQVASAAAVAQNALVAATALGYGSMWRTGDPAYDRRVKAALGLSVHDAIVGFLYLGTVPEGAAKPPRQPKLDGVVEWWGNGADPGAEGGAQVGALPYDQRPVDYMPRHTDDLPPTPTRDRNIPASAWQEAPPELLRLGDDIGQSHDINYKRRIGPWLLWRAGPATGGDARYMAVHVDERSLQHTFRLFPDGSGEGEGPDGRLHTRFRSWKESLLSAGD
jgi:nitroreductase